jgi:hypothetical protein
MKSIRHVNSTYDFWLESIEYVQERKEDILFIGFQISLDKDFERLKNILHLPKILFYPKTMYWLTGHQKGLKQRYPKKPLQIFLSGTKTTLSFISSVKNCG